VPKVDAEWLSFSAGFVQFCVLIRNFLMVGNIIPLCLRRCGRTYSGEKMFKLVSLPAALLLAATAAVAVPQNAEAVDAFTAASVLASLSVSDESNAGYDRSLFKHWTDDNGNGCDTRSEVLQAESVVPVTFSEGCTVATGKWTSRYDGATWTAASDVDIDHMVPLAEAWGSGAQAWTSQQRQAYANDLGLGVALEAVTDNVNQSKSDNDPAQWLPPLAGTSCAYSTDWVLVKYRWQLSIDPAEQAALSSILSNDCGAQTVTLPSVQIETAAEVAPVPVSFRDVTSGTQFYSEISWLADRGISTGWVEGDGSRTYRPLSPVARDAMAAFLYRLDGKPAFDPPAISPFTDVDASNQFYKEITWLAARGISTGWTEPNGTRTFRPLQPVNRDAMAAFLYRYAGSPWYQSPSSSPFIDISTGNQFYQQITWLASRGISTGWDVGSGCRAFGPVQPVARDAMAAFMYRFVNGGTGSVTSGCTPPSSGGGTTPPPQPPVVQPPAPSKPANPGNTKNCTTAYFATWREAQNWYEFYFPYYGDVAGLDGNNDGVACESLPGHP
jgi:hypothetical protein